MRAAAQAQVPLQGMFDSRGGKEMMSQGGAEAMKRAARASRSRPGLKGRRVQRVLLVGAASRMPAVSTMLYEMVGERPSTGGVQPELAVALGAATQAGILEGSVTQVDVFNVLEAALIRGIAQGPSPTQRQKRGPSKSKSKRKRR